MSALTAPQYSDRSVRAPFGPRKKELAMLVWIPTAVAAWFTIGLLVAVPFLLVGVGRAVEGARGSSVAFRLVVLPAAALLWPVMLRLWIGSARPGGRRA